MRAAATAEVLLERHGVVTRGAVQAEGVPGGFALVYKVLAALEEAGRARRGYFVERLGAAQFSTAGTVDRLRARTRRETRATEPDDPAVLVLAATDPANPYGAALAWPTTARGHRPGRKAGALVVLVDGELVVYVERGGRTVLLFRPDEDAIRQRPRRGWPRWCAAEGVPQLVGGEGGRRVRARHARSARAAARRRASPRPRRGCGCACASCAHRRAARA